MGNELQIVSFQNNVHTENDNFAHLRSQDTEPLQKACATVGLANHSPTSQILDMDRIRLVPRTGSKPLIRTLVEVQIVPPLHSGDVPKPPCFQPSQHQIYPLVVLTIYARLHGSECTPQASCQIGPPSRDPEGNSLSGLLLDPA